MKNNRRPDLSDKLVRVITWPLTALADGLTSITDTRKVQPLMPWVALGCAIALVIGMLTGSILTTPFSVGMVVTMLLCSWGLQTALNGNRKR